MVMLRLYYGQGSKRYRKRSGNGARTERERGEGVVEEWQKSGRGAAEEQTKGERRFSGKLITRVDKITDIGEKVRGKFANTEKFL